MQVGKVKPIPRSDQHILTLNIPCKYISILHILDIISLPTWRWWVPLVVPITAKVAVLGPTTADVAVVGPSNEWWPHSRGPIFDKKDINKFLKAKGIEPLTSHLTKLVANHYSNISFV